MFVPQANKAFRKNRNKSELCIHVISDLINICFEISHNVSNA